MTDEITNGHESKLDKLEAWMLQGPPVEIPVEHLFLPGLYIRVCRIDAGTVLTSMRHNTRHPFFILAGEILVTSDSEGDRHYKAPYFGITEPGTRRGLLALSDTVWITIHANPNNHTDPDKIGEEILAKHENPLLDGAPAERLNGWRKDSPYQGPGQLPKMRI